MDNTYIQSKADTLLTDTLRDLFHFRNCELGVFEANQKFEKGIDYFFEVFNANKEHEQLFLNQNKGTFAELQIIKNKNHPNFDKIAFQISIRHAEYFYFQLEEAIIFTICDLNTRTIFYYDIQNDLTLPERIVNQKRSNIDSLQIFIPQTNILNEQTFDKFLERIDYAKYSQSRKKGNVNILEADYSETVKGSSKLEMIDKIIHTIDLFESIIVLPENVICELYPFKGTKSKSYIDNSELNTDNEEFFDFMSQQFDKRNIKQNDLSDKLKHVISFFQSNEIYHLHWTGKGRKSKVCLHDFFVYSECNCERCNLERLNLIETKKLLKDENPKTIYDLLKRGYTHYLLGNYKDSYEIFYKVYTEANKNQNPINFTISKYNLIKLRGLIKSFYYENDRNEIIAKLENIKFENDERFVKEYAPYFVDIYKNIKDLKFYDNVFDKIDDSFLKIQKFHYKDKHGGSESDAAFYKLQSSFLRFKSYLHHNFIIFNHFQEYEQLSQKILESLLILHTLKNPETNKYEIFDWYALELWIFNVKEDFTTYLFRKYEIKTITISIETFNKLEVLIDNLLKSQTEFNKYSSVYSPLRLGRIINNITAIVTLVNKNPKEKESIISKILSNSKILLKYNLMPFDGLNFYGIKQESFISKTILKKIVDLLILNNSRFRYFELLEKYFELCTEKELEKFIYKILKIKTLDEINVNSVDFEDLLYAFSLLSQKNKDYLKTKFNNILEKDFDSSLYSNLLLYDLIDFEINNFDKLLSCVVNKSNFDERRFPFHSYQNVDLYNVMSIVFKYNLKIDEKIKAQINKVFHKERDYFEWLMDIDNYDYTKFNSYWILKSRTKYFTERFKKSSRLKIEIEKSLKVNYIEGVSKMYFKELT